MKHVTHKYMSRPLRTLNNLCSLVTVQNSFLINSKDISFLIAFSSLDTSGAARRSRARRTAAAAAAAAATADDDVANAAAIISRVGNIF